MPRLIKITHLAILLAGFLTACGGKESNSGEGADALDTIERTVESGVQPDSDISSTSGGQVTVIPEVHPGINNPALNPPSPAPAPPVVSVPDTVNIYYVQGYQTLHMATDIPIEEDFLGWNPVLSSSRVENGNVLTANYLSMKIERE